MIMYFRGLLIGDVTDDGDSVTLTAIRIGRRMTKQKDRVEIDDAVSIEASEYAESMGKRVLGWYHSHPRITVHPSHLDLGETEKCLVNTLLHYLLTSQSNFKSSSQNPSTC